MMKEILLLCVTSFFTTWMAATAVEENQCPGVVVMKECSSSSAVRWEGSAFMGECGGDNITANIRTGLEPSLQCGRFTANNMAVTNPRFPEIETLQSVLSFNTETMSRDLNGTSITCVTPDDIPVNITLRLLDISPTDLHGNQLLDRPTHSQFTWTVSDEAAMCNLNFNLFISRTSPTGFNSTIQATQQSVEVQLPPGLYSFQVTAISGSEQVSSSQEFSVMNEPLPPNVTTNLDGQCFMYNFDVNWTNAEGNLTTPSVQEFVFVHAVDDATTKTRLNSSTTTTLISTTEQQLGKTNCFMVAAMNKIGTSRFGSACVNVPLVVEKIVVETTMSTATLTYTVNMTCVTTGGDFSITTKLQSADISSSSRITQSTVSNTLSNLQPGKRYQYCTVITDNLGNTLEICGENLGGGSFTTDVPIPPMVLNGAMLLRIQDNMPVYECPGSLQGFNGESKTMSAAFNPAEGVYALSGSCQIVTWFIVVMIFLVILAIAVAIVIFILCVLFNPWCLPLKKKLFPCCSNEKGIREPFGHEDSHEMKHTNNSDGGIKHEEHPETGDEYAVVTSKNKSKSVESSTDPPSVYQDPNTIEHEKAPETGALYAVTEKKPKKKKGSEKQPTEDELAMMYSVPDKTRKNQGGLTYADVDVAALRGGEKPLQQPLQTEYASVVN